MKAIVMFMLPKTLVQIRHMTVPDDIPNIAKLLAQLGWGYDNSDERIRLQQALAGSSWIAIAEMDGQFAGYARALSDGVLVTYLVEVAVLPALRRRGVGGSLIQSCLDSFPDTAIYADAAPEIVQLNIRYGILPRPEYLTACARGARLPVGKDN